MARPNGSQLDDIARVIAKEAFWGDSTYTLDDIVQILSDPHRYDERYYIFQRSLLNLREPAILTKVFPRDEVREFLTRISPEQRFPHLSERVKIWRNVFCGEENEIPKAKWRYFVARRIF